jgi:tetratricopeptide (TPR) repeat protein
LPKNQVVSLSEHLSSCAECRLVVESAAEAQAEEQAETIEPQGRRPWRWLSIAAVIGAGVLLTPVAQKQWQVYKREVAMRELVDYAASLSTRVIEPRIADLPFGEKPRVTRGLDSEGEKEDQSIITGRASKVIESAANDHSAAAAHARGIAYLLTRDTTAATQELTAATKAGPNDAKAWSDLAAAKLVANDNAGARDAANRALSIEPSLDDARFNRALAVSRLQPAESIKEWTEYLKHDTTGDWAKEARQRINTAREFP